MKDTKWPILGQEAVVGRDGLGRVTEIGPADRCGSGHPEWIGVTPYAGRKWQMNFAPHNVQLIPIYGLTMEKEICISGPVQKSIDENASIKDELDMLREMNQSYMDLSVYYKDMIFDLIEGKISIEDAKIAMHGDERGYDK
jgi:hypothetical protein